MSDKKKIYSIGDVIGSQEPKDIEMNFKDGIVKLRIKPIKYGELQLLMRAKAKQDPWEQGNAMFLESVKKLEKDDNGVETEKPFTEAEMKQLPPGFVTKVMDEVNAHAGLTASIDSLKNF